ncbi:hypothetical protein BDR06DRAFT_1016327 [Suillus hirtellus]|nr:hypothetical protein BDR06DRAFT_1016327 [Suillus hirtellus]
MNYCGHHQQNANIPQVEAASVPVPAPVSPALIAFTPIVPAPTHVAPAPTPVAPTPMPNTPAPTAATTTVLHRPRRQWQLPQRYRQDDVAAHPDDGKWIDINNVGNSEDNDDPPQVVATTHTQGPSPPQTTIKMTTSTLHTNPFAMRKRGLKTTSDIQFFFRKNSDTGKCICVPCEDSNKIDSSYPLTIYGLSTSNTPLHSHIHKVHIDLYLEESEKQQWPISIHPVSDCLNEGWTFSKMQKQLQNSTCIKFIVADDQAISVVKCPEFHQLLCLLWQDLKDSDILHHSKLQQLIIDAWNEYFAAIKLDLTLHSFLAVTAHWIAKEHEATLVLKAALIAFHHIPGSHTEKALASKILELIDYAEVKHNIGHFTLDNATGPYTFKKVKYVKALQSDVITQARDIVHVIHSSGQHCDSFRAAITSGNAEGWFTNNNGERMALPIVELLCDEPTHLDLTYVMFNHLRILWQAINHWIDLPAQCSIACYKLSPMDWQVLQDLEVILECPTMHVWQNQSSSK